MSTYQVTVVVAPLVNITAPPVAPSATPVTCWTVDRGATASLLPGCAFAAALAAEAMGYYAAAFGGGAPYPIPKLDLAYLPVFPVGAMEQFGLITFAEGYLAAGANGSAAAAGVVAHEVAHQWWGNRATAAWWDALWLQEGAATFWPNVALPALRPGLRYEEGWRAATAGAMAEDAFAASPALTAAPPPASAGASYAVFGATAYDKGAAAYAALRARVEAASPGAFLRGLAALQAAAAFRAFTPTDLLAALAGASGAAGLGEECSALRDALNPGFTTTYAGYTCWRFVVDDPSTTEVTEAWGRGQPLGIVPLAPR